MAEFALTLTDADAGTVAASAPVNGYLQSLKLVRLGPYENPDWIVAERRYRAAYLSLRGTLDHKPLYCASPQSSAPNFTGLSIPYFGGLFIESVPAGAIVSVVVTDTPATRRSRTGPVLRALPPPSQMGAVTPPRSIEYGR